MHGWCGTAIPAGAQRQTVTSLSYNGFFLIGVLAPVPIQHATKPLFPQASLVADIRATDVVACFPGAGRYML